VAQQNGSVILKNIKVRPESVPNSGKGRVQVEALVFSSGEDARIEGARVDLSSLGGNPDEPMRFVKAEGIPGTREGLYRITFQVPALADPGAHPIPLFATDSLGHSGRSVAELRVLYKRPAFRGSILSASARTALDRASGTGPLGDNRVEALSCGNAAMEARMDLVRAATRQINLQVYTMAMEGLCGEFLEAVLEKAARGVEVNVLVNMNSQLAVSPFTLVRVGLHRVGRELQGLSARVEEILESRQGLGEIIRDIQSAFERVTSGRGGVNAILVGEDAILGADRQSPPQGQRSRKWLDRLERYHAELSRRDAGFAAKMRIGVRRYTALPSLPGLTYAVHEKILVVDGARAIVGGRNLEDRYFSHWIDLDLLLEGPVVRVIQQGFLRNWEFFVRNLKEKTVPSRVFDGARTAGELQARFVQSRPWLGEYQTMETLVTAIQLARKRIFVSSQYLVLPESLVQAALIEAAERGVDVRILTNSYHTGQEVGFSAGHSITLRYCEPLLNAGVRIYEMKGPDDEKAPRPYLHAKEFYVDGKWAAVGSFNLSMRSCFIESENLVVVEDPAFVEAREEAFLDRLRRAATEMTRKSLKEEKERFKAMMAVTDYLDLFF
jgi:phosphatidylserine/phosphatidylglycerophosphate/cardiolipin synthase-like enzyme